MTPKKRQQTEEKKLAKTVNNNTSNSSTNNDKFSSVAKRRKVRRSRFTEDQVKYFLLLSLSRFRIKRSFFQNSTYPF
jgi:hypothetical protein